MAMLIDVTLGNGKVSVPLYKVVGPFGIHRTVTGVDDSGDTVQAELSSSGWSVSHIQSGLAVATLLGQRAAVVLARELDASFPEYQKKGRKKWRSL